MIENEGLLLSLLIVVGAISFACEYVDAAIGMGYGTALTPILLAMGLSLIQVVPAVLFGQIAGGLSGSLSHNSLGNMNLRFIKGNWSLDSKVVAILIGCGIIGALISVLVAISIPSIAVKIYIGIMVLGIGIWILIRRNKEKGMSWRGLALVGVVSSFNKGISGGGYGPIVTGGQVVNGRKVKNSIGSTTFAEAFVCLVAFLVYLIASQGIDWRLCFTACSGALLGAPLSAFTVKAANPARLKIVIGVVTVALGIFTLVKVLL